MSSDGGMPGKTAPTWLFPSTCCTYALGVLLRRPSPEQRRKQKRS